MCAILAIMDWFVLKKSNEAMFFAVVALTMIIIFQMKNKKQSK